MEINNCAVPSCKRSIRSEMAFCLWHYSHLSADDRQRLEELVRLAHSGDWRYVTELGECIADCCKVIQSAMRPASVARAAK